MTLVREIATDAAIGVAVAATPEGLSALHRPGCAAAIRRRQSLPELQSWIDGLDPNVLPRAIVILRSDAARDAVTTNACRRFHIDAVTARLVCTYRGTGTQYGIGADGAEPRRVFTVPTGAPILLRGTLWPERPHSGLLHCSPPIEGTGETRLVLVLDPVDDPEEEV
jgi:hypothetical protein